MTQDAAQEIGSASGGSASGSGSAWIACESCDLLLRRPVLRRPGKAKCPRCGSVVGRYQPDSVNRTLALALASLLLYLVAQGTWFMSFELDGLTQKAWILTGMRALFLDGKWPLASLILLTAVLAPLLATLSLLWLLIPLRLGRRPWAVAAIMRFRVAIDRWAMMEVFLLGVLVTYTKLVGMANVAIGPGGWTFFALILVSTWAGSCFDPDVVWERSERAT